MVHSKKLIKFICTQHNGNKVNVLSSILYTDVNNKYKEKLYRTCTA